MTAVRQETAPALQHRKSLLSNITKAALTKFKDHERTWTRTSANATRIYNRHRHSGSPSSTVLQPKEKHEDTDVALYQGRAMRRRHIDVEYLGVSVAAFPRPLQRYIRSPVHGRRVLRSSPPPNILFGRVHTAAGVGAGVPPSSQQQTHQQTLQQTHQHHNAKRQNSDAVWTTGNTRRLATTSLLWVPAPGAERKKQRLLQKRRPYDQEKHPRGRRRRDDVRRSSSGYCCSGTQDWCSGSSFRSTGEEVGEFDEHAAFRRLVGDDDSTDDDIDGVFARQTSTSPQNCVQTMELLMPVGPDSSDESSDVANLDIGGGLCQYSFSSSHGAMENRREAHRIVAVENDELPPTEATIRALNKQEASLVPLSSSKWQIPAAGDTTNSPGSCSNGGIGDSFTEGREATIVRNQARYSTESSTDCHQQQPQIHRLPWAHERPRTSIPRRHENDGCSTRGGGAIVIGEDGDDHDADGIDSVSRGGGLNAVVARVSSAVRATQRVPRGKGTWDFLTGRKARCTSRGSSNARHYSSNDGPVTADPEVAGRDGEGMQEEVAAGTTDALCQQPLGVMLKTKKGWEPRSMTHSTPTTRRSLTLFHEQAQRSRLLEGNCALSRLPRVKEPETGVKPATVVQSRLIRQMPPPSRWPEEKRMRIGDMLVTIEHCAACGRHSMSLHHNADSYARRAEAVKAAVEKALANEVCRSDNAQPTCEKRNTVLLKPTTGRAKGREGVGRVGAFEVQVAACLLAAALGKTGMGADSGAKDKPSCHKNASTDERTCAVRQGDNGNVVIRSATISSKLSSGRWPHPERVSKGVIEKLRMWGALSAGGGAALGHYDTKSHYVINDDRNIVSNQPECQHDKNDIALTAEGSKSAVAHAGRGNRNVVGGTSWQEKIDGDQQQGDEREVKGGGNGGEEFAIRGATNETPARPATSKGCSLPSLERVSMVIENIEVTGVEFAAAGNTADPFFILRVGHVNGKQARTAVAEDIAGGAEGHCRWPNVEGGGVIITDLKEHDVQVAGFEIEVWDDLGWVIATGKIPPDEACLAIEAAKAKATTEGSDDDDKQDQVELPPAQGVGVMCALTSSRGSEKCGQATFTVRAIARESRDGGDDGSDDVCGNEADDPDRNASNGLGDITDRAEEATESTAGGPKFPSEVGKMNHRVFADLDELLHSSRGTSDDSSGRSTRNAGIESDEFSSLFNGPDERSYSSHLNKHTDGPPSGVSPTLAVKEPLQTGLKSNVPQSIAPHPSPSAAEIATVTPVLHTTAILPTPGPSAKSLPLSVSPRGLTLETWGATEEAPIATGEAMVIAERKDGDQGNSNGHEATSRPPNLSAVASGSEYASDSFDDDDDGAENRNNISTGDGNDNVTPSIRSQNKGQGVDEQEKGSGGTVESVTDPNETGATQRCFHSSPSLMSSSVSSSTSENIYHLWFDSGSDDSTMVAFRDPERETSDDRNRAEVVAVAADAARLRRRLKRAAEKCGGGDAVAGAPILFRRLDEDQDGQLTAEEVEGLFAPRASRKALPRTSEDKDVDNDEDEKWPRGDSKATPSASRLAALVAGMDRAGKRSANLKDFEAFLLAENPPLRRSEEGDKMPSLTDPQPLEMAAIWLRLRQSMETEITTTDESAASEGTVTDKCGLHESARGSMSVIHSVRHTEESKEEEGHGVIIEKSEAVNRTPGASGSDHAPSELMVGGSFEHCDPDETGHMSLDAFCPVVRGSLGQATARYPLTEDEIGAVAKHFTLNTDGSEASDDGGGASMAVQVSHGDFLAWLNPVDVGRVAKRISRFLRAIGDPASRSKFGLWTQDDESGAGKSNVDGVVHRGRTDEGRKRSRAAGVHRAGHDSGLSSLVEDKGGQETEVEEEEEDLQGGAERRAIFDLFRAVDIDASGRISQEELITTVNNLGLPVTAAEARLLIIEYGGADAKGELSFDDFDCLIRGQTGKNARQ